MREHLHTGDVCIDVGANVGVLTFLASSIVGPDGRVIAVEPNPENVQMLYRNVAFTHAANVEVFPLAASDRRTVFSMTGRSNTHLVPPREAALFGGDFVQSVALDDLFGDLPRLNFVKMDIEGHEPAALRGMRKLLARHHPTLLVEFNPRCLRIQSEDPVEFIKLLLSLYPAVRVISQFDDDATFDQANDVIEHWQRRSDELTEKGRMPDGFLHFDLAVRAS
jgi:FkbM family methyltransferase